MKLWTSFVVVATLVCARQGQRFCTGASSTAMTAMSERQRVWRGLPHSVAARRKPEPPAIVPIVWDPAGDDMAQDAALRAATRVRVLKAVAVCPAAKEESPRQPEPESAAAKEAAVRKKASEKRVTVAKAACERAAQVPSKMVGADRAEPLQLARASLAASERVRRFTSQLGRAAPLRDLPSETGRQLLVALGVDENDAGNTKPGRHRSLLKSGGVPRTRQEFKNESSRAHVLSMPSGQSLSRTRSQSSQSLNATTPWLGIGFDGASARGLGREDEALAHEELLTSEERESCSELGGDAPLQQLQAELERVRHLEALLEIEKARAKRGLPIKI